MPFYHGKNENDMVGKIQLNLFQHYCHLLKEIGALRS
jgi:hypothetical protein